MSVVTTLPLLKALGVISTLCLIVYFVVVHREDFKGDSNGQ